MPKLRREIENEDGWTRWIQPVMQGYRLACCDCGLVHTMEFRVLKIAKENGVEVVTDELPPDEYQVEFRASRNNRSTVQMRRHMKGTHKHPT